LLISFWRAGSTTVSVDPIAEENDLTPGVAGMDDTLCQAFFRQPACPAQRQYEALRAVFVGGLPQSDAAARFGYSPDAFRQLVHRFRQGIAAGTAPPFSSLNAEAARPARS
jgi:DNA-directed RNA polymerase specialized sigma24 family protein